MEEGTVQRTIRNSGCGKTFYQMDDRNHGEADLKDCVAGKDWLAQQDYIDPGKIGISANLMAVLW